MEDKFKEYQIAETKKVVDTIYNKWINSKNDTHESLEDLSDSIYYVYEADVKCSQFSEKRDYWFQKFKDEEMIIDKLKKDFGWWKN